MLFIANGFYNVIMDAQQRTTANTLRNEMILITFFTSAVISLDWLLFMKRSEAPKAFVMPKKAAFFAIGSSLAAAVAANVQLAALRFVPASILFTTLSGGLLIINTVLSVGVLKEKVTRLQIAAIAVAVASLIFLNV